MQGKNNNQEVVKVAWGPKKAKCSKCGQEMLWRGGKWVCMNPDCEKFGERSSQRGTLGDQLKAMMEG